MRNNSYPINTDKLFIPEQNGISWLPNGIDDIFQISEGYRLAAVTLYESIKQNEDMGKKFMSCSMIFCFRQFLEIRIKELIYFGKKELFDDPGFNNTHNLEDLYQTYVRDVLPNIDSNYDKNMTSVVNKLIHEFNFHDPKSMNFRYPMLKDNTPSLIIKNLDIDNFKDVMDKLSNYFDSQLELIHMIQDFNSEMASEMASEYMSYLYSYIY